MAFRYRKALRHDHLQAAGGLFFQRNIRKRQHDLICRIEANEDRLDCRSQEALAGEARFRGAKQQSTARRWPGLDCGNPKIVLT